MTSTISSTVLNLGQIMLLICSHRLSHTFFLTRVRLYDVRFLGP